jgi:hypothetical protein
VTLCFPQVGDNVGDCAARGADLFESIAAEIISAMILGGTMAKKCKIAGQSFVLGLLIETSRRSSQAQDDCLKAHLHWNVCFKSVERALASQVD